MPGEFEYITWVTQQLAKTGQGEGVVVGPGDDCAVVSLSQPNTKILVTKDILTEGVDFILAETTPNAVGRKAMGVNLSDIAAMAGRPRFAIVGLVLPKSGGRTLAEGLFRGLHAMANEHNVSIVGGDTNTWGGGLVISITVIGEATKGGPILRSGAKVGDEIFVTGPVGGSFSSRHLNPTPRLREAEMLHEKFTIHAMIDISDGLAADLGHILTASSCGAKLIAEQIPIHADAIHRSQFTGRTPLDHALNDGEDFELIYTAPPGQSITDAKIGTITHQSYTIIENGIERPVQPQGWEHGV